MTTTPSAITSAPGLLRLFTCGSVDDGKSTLIGRLLHDSRSLHEDQIDSVRRASERRGQDALDLSLLTDGLRAEREQGITIDVAYRYFATARRRFILADTPGHVQYTRNMATGASTADVAIVLIDARQGVVEQTRRHACLSALLGVSRIVVCINKMDLVGYQLPRFEAVREQFLEFARRARPDGEGTVSELVDIDFIPISALNGDNVVEQSAHMPWFQGPPLLHLLESLPAGGGPVDQGVRLPVQRVIRPNSPDHHDYRGYAGRLASGAMRVGDPIRVLPSGLRSTIKAMHIGPTSVESVSAPLSCAVELHDDLDISRGDMLVGEPSDHAFPGPSVLSAVEAAVIWMSPLPLTPRRRLLLKHTTRQCSAVAVDIPRRLNMQTLELEPKAETLALHELGRVRFRLAEPIVADAYRQNRTTGSFILIDEHTNNTVGAGLIVSDPTDSGGILSVDGIGRK